MEILGIKQSQLIRTPMMEARRRSAVEVVNGSSASA